MISHHEIQQNTARIARTAMIVVICRAFLRSVLLLVIARQWIITDRSRKYRPPGNESFCRSFTLYTVPAVGAVGILTSFTDGL